MHMKLDQIGYITNGSVRRAGKEINIPVQNFEKEHAPINAELLKTLARIKMLNKPDEQWLKKQLSKLEEDMQYSKACRDFSAASAEADRVWSLLETYEGYKHQELMNKPLRDPRPMKQEEPPARTGKVNVMIEEYEKQYGDIGCMSHACAALMRGVASAHIPQGSGENYDSKADWESQKKLKDELDQRATLLSKLHLRHTKAFS